ncbi:glutamyl-tRNA reductase [Sansalvadorimonas sp. 2012CJ34-2]|uniref:Glutamyl-tRNA reductase n=1 Tax=Parendozoicomonas callyspongiae TaxID=2942213 RepID=A0ABT0PG88_9GAMM|nr:glutamyl-tRNA reductase [Sansalvadorimonas sp. 2012CJ34-2]MCL6270340.1 glutamyl-tRNA reductase [Sansalvadorimonas sp. 2012CJ34-2]
MGFLAVGINHRTAPVSLRETVSFTPEQLIPALRDLHQLGGIQEAAILSTCNRTEIYSNGQTEPDRILEWLSAFHHTESELLLDHSYCHSSRDAVRHMMRVASGLDSLVLGEPQILGQMKSAYAVAQEAGTTHGLLGRMFQSVFTTAKTVRTRTAIGENPVSVAFAAVSLSKQIFSNLSSNTALLIGAGETIELVARHLKDQGIGKLIIANRTLERALRLADMFNGEAILLSDIPESLHRADIIIASTASQLPILGKGAVERALKRRRHNPMFMVDIAVPRDIEPEVGDLADVYLYTVDDLRQVIEDNVRNRQEAALEAEKLIEAGADDFLARLRALDAVDAVRAYRSQAEAIQSQELDKALRMLESGRPPELVVQQLARGLTNKLIHSPCVQLRQAGSKGQTDKIDWARELLELDLPVDEPV